MKNILMVTLFGVLLLVGCATVPKTPITQNDLTFLKGTWEGGRDMIWGRYRSLDHTIMEVYNDMVPLKGKVTIAFMEGSDTRVYPFENGWIDAQGNLVVQLAPEIKFTLSLYREEQKLKLGGNYIHRGNEGRLTLRKK